MPGSSFRQQTLQVILRADIGRRGGLGFRFDQSHGRWIVEHAGHRLEGLDAETLSRCQILAHLRG